MSSKTSSRVFKQMVTLLAVLPILGTTIRTSPVKRGYILHAPVWQEGPALDIKTEMRSTDSSMPVVVTASFDIKTKPGYDDSSVQTEERPSSETRTKLGYNDSFTAASVTRHSVTDEDSEPFEGNLYSRTPRTTPPPNGPYTSAPAAGSKE